MVLALVGYIRPIVQRVAGDLGGLAQKDCACGNIRSPGQLGLEHRTCLDQGMAVQGQNGARIEGLFMCLIHNCQLNEVNPFEYLNVLQNHSEQFEANPSLWMPWNHRENLTRA